MRNAQVSLLVAIVGAAAGAGLAQDFEIFVVAPSFVMIGPHASYRVEVWGQVSGGVWVDGISAFARFGIDIMATSGGVLVDSVSTAHDPGGGIILASGGFAAGPHLLGVSGGQLANLFGILNPDIDLRNPIQLFSFEVTVTGSYGVVEYTPMNPAANGGLSFYPYSTEGTMIVAPNDPGTTLTLTGASTVINPPSPGTAVVMGMGVLCVRRRR